MRRGRCAAGPDHRTVEARGRRALRRHHLETGEGGRSRAGPVAQRHGPRLPLADRAHAAAVRPLHLPPSLQGVPGQPPQPERRHRHRGLPREHRRSVRRRRIQPGPGRVGRHVAAALAAVRALRRPEGRRVRGVVQDQHAQGLGAHHRRGVRLRAQARQEESDRRAQGQRRARDRRDVPRDRPRGRPRVTPRSRSTRPTSTR